MRRRQMSLSQALTAAPATPAIYTLLRNNVPFYVGESTNLRSRLRNHAGSIRLLRAGNLSEYRVSFVLLPGTSTVRRRGLERNHIRRVDQRLLRRGLPGLTNVRRESFW
jgi:excinuclease UvrABC nuclease subunit